METYDLETQEIIDKLEASGFKALLEAIMYADGTYNAKGRINKSALCRTLDIKPAQLEEQLYQFRAAAGDVLEDPPYMPLALKAKLETAAKAKTLKEQPKAKNVNHKEQPPKAPRTVNHIVYRCNTAEKRNARKAIPWKKGQLDEHGQICDKIVTEVNDDQTLITVYFKAQ